MRRSADGRVPARSSVLVAPTGWPESWRLRFAHANQALRLSPFDPLAFMAHRSIARLAYRFGGKQIEPTAVGKLDWPLAGLGGAYKGVVEFTRSES